MGSNLAFQKVIDTFVIKKLYLSFRANPCLAAGDPLFMPRNLAPTVQGTMKYS